jgi:D-aspartate ligase
MAYGNAEFVPVLLGTSLNSYSIARTLHETYGVRTLALGRYPLRETAESSIIDVRAYRDFDDPTRVVEVLEGIAEEFAGRTLLLLANIEYYTNVVLAHRARLDPLFVIPMIDAATAGRLMNKTDFYRTCAELGVPHPHTVEMAQENLADAHLGEGLPFSYPVVLKPSNTDTYARMSFEGKKKVFIVADAQELRDSARRIYDAGYDDLLVIQEFLRGDESVMRVVNTYSDRHGRMRLLSAGQIVLSEYNPKLVGNYNAVVSIHDAALTESIRHFLDSIEYVGPANFDVMYDVNTGESRLLEINLRQGAASHYVMAAGANFAQCYVEDLIHHVDLEEQLPTAERLWVNVPYLVVRFFAPRSVRSQVVTARNHGVTHTLRYSADSSWKRRLNVLRIDLRHTLDYIKFASVRPRQEP